MAQILEINGPVTIGGQNITFQGVITDSIIFQLGSVVSVTENPATNKTLIFAPIISITEPPATIESRLLEYGPIISLTESPATCKLLQLGVYISISPGKARPHYPLNVQSRGPVNLFKDMPVFGRKN